MLLLLLNDLSHVFVLLLALHPLNVVDDLVDQLLGSDFLGRLSQGVGDLVLVLGLRVVALVGRPVSFFFLLLPQPLE